MDSAISFSVPQLLTISKPLIIFSAVLIFGYIARKIIFSRLTSWSKKTKSELDDIIIAAIGTPFIIWCLMLGVYLALKFSEMPESLVGLAGKTLLVLGIFSITLVLANMSNKLVRFYSDKLAGALPVTSLTQNIIKIIIFAVGILVILNTLGISITPILATLGVGGLAVALALQDTLSNLFAGFYITLARQVRVGNFVKLESGEEGYILDIGWRSTRVRMLPNNVVIIPNSKLSQSVITNYYLPEKELAVLVQVGVHYESDLGHVEKVTCQVGKEVMKEVPGGVPEFDPFIRYHTFADFSINFTVILRAKEFVDNYMIKHEFIKRLHKRYAQEGIVIPYPIRAINYEQEKEA